MAARITRKAAPITAALLASAAVVAHLTAPDTAKFEGVKTTGYIDRLSRHKVATVCAGQTGYIKVNGKLLAVRAGMRVKYADCVENLSASELQWAIVGYRVTPGITAYPHTWRAVTDFIHQYGEGRYRSSLMARDFNAGYWLRGCYAFMHYTKSNHIVYPGLVTRSKWRRAKCLSDH